MKKLQPKTAKFTLLLLFILCFFKTVAFGESYGLKEVYSCSEYKSSFTTIGCISKSNISKNTIIHFSDPSNVERNIEKFDIALEKAMLVSAFTGLRGQVKGLGSNFKKLANVKNSSFVPKSALVTPEGIPFPLGEINQHNKLNNILFSKNSNDGKLRVSQNKGLTVGGKNVKIGNNLERTPHGWKHVAPKNVSWEKIVDSTVNGAAKYLPSINIEKIEHYVWKKGIEVSNGKQWKVMKFESIIGASNGKQSHCMIVKCSNNTIHGHPITEIEYKKLTKK